MEVRATMFFFFNDTATTEIYTLSLHDALPIFEVEPEALPVPDGLQGRLRRPVVVGNLAGVHLVGEPDADLLEDVEDRVPRSEEHTSELQSRQYLVCRLLLEKKKRNITRLKARH